MKRDLSTESKSSSDDDDEDDSEISDTETDDQSDTNVKQSRIGGPSRSSETGKKSQVDTSFKIIKLKDYKP